MLYHRGVPKLWSHTIEAHRHDVREAILETTWALASERGLLGVTMSRIAEQVGIGRATLYKYFPDVESILAAWHERHVTEHLARLAELKDREGTVAGRLEAVLLGYARICFHRAGHGAAELGPLLHRGAQVATAQEHLHHLFRDLLTEAAAAGVVRQDAAPDELASYCLHALAAAGSMTSDEAVQRLASITLAALAPPR